jgi:hypothetical protein
MRSCPCKCFRVGLLESLANQFITQAVLQRLHISLPNNIDTDCHVRKVVKEAITEALTQARSAIKKSVGSSPFTS